MKRPTHSPGPWRTGQDGDYIGINAIFDAHGVVIADASDRSSRATDKQRRANATLMASAFELHAALALLVERHDTRPSMLTSAEWNQARAALGRGRTAKARPIRGEGWDVFNEGDHIERVDQPDTVGLKVPPDDVTSIEPAFSGDDEAIMHVIAQAHAGDAVCIDALWEVLDSDDLANQILWQFNPTDEKGR